MPGRLKVWHTPTPTWRYGDLREHVCLACHCKGKAERVLVTPSVPLQVFGLTARSRHSRHAVTGVGTAGPFGRRPIGAGMGGIAIDNVAYVSRSAGGSTSARTQHASGRAM